jgi:hypothetical protein
LVRARAEISILCCCGPEVMAPSSAATLPDGIMNVHDATFDLDAPWDVDAYKSRHVRDALWTVVSALDKVIRECLGDPHAPSQVRSRAVVLARALALSRAPMRARRSSARSRTTDGTAAGGGRDSP